MKKKVVAMIAVVGLMSNMCIAYGSTTESEVLDSNQTIESVVEESGDNGTQVVQNEPEKVYEVSDDCLVVENINGDSGESSGVSELVETEEEDKEVRYETVVVTTGSCIFGDMHEEIDEYTSMDFPGSFEINPYAGRMKGTKVDVVNTGETELVVIAEACYKNDYNSPEVVSPNKFSNWANLNVEETASNIAFGFIVRNEDGEKIDTFWFEGEEDQKPEVVYVLEPDEHITLEITGKHGMSWIKACTLSYDCIVGFEVIPEEKLVEQVVEKEDTVEQEESAVEEIEKQEELVDDKSDVSEEQVNTEETTAEKTVETEENEQVNEGSITDSEAVEENNEQDNNESEPVDEDSTNKENDKETTDEAVIDEIKHEDSEDNQATDNSESLNEVNDDEAAVTNEPTKSENDDASQSNEDDNVSNNETVENESETIND